MKQCIQLTSINKFKLIMHKYNEDYKQYMWSTFRESTCYIPAEKCFISLDKALKLNYEIINE